MIEIDEELQKPINVKVMVDDYIISFETNITTAIDYDIEISDTVWSALDIGKHTITISATDGTHNADRIYTFDKVIEIQHLPSISGVDGTLGNRNKAFNQSYYIEDEDDSVTLTITEMLDKETNIINTRNNAIRNNNYTCEITQSLLDSIEMGVHKIIIKVEDGKGNYDTRIYSFYKYEGDNVPPVISGSDENLGLKDTEFYKFYSVNDENKDDKIQVKVYLDGEIIDCMYKATRNFQYYIYVNNDIFNNLKEGKHTIQIVADDGIAIDRRILTFEKKTKQLEDFYAIELNDKYFNPIECKQHDDLEFNIKLYQYGIPFDVSDYELQFNVRDNNDKIISLNESKVTKQSDNIINISCNGNITKQYGLYYGEIVLIKDGNRISTFDIKIMVRKDVIDDE